jgi:hypothetical protein
MEGVHGRSHEAVEAGAGGCAGSRCLKKFHFGYRPTRADAEIRTLNL